MNKPLYMIINDEFIYIRIVAAVSVVVGVVNIVVFVVDSAAWYEEIDVPIVVGGAVTVSVTIVNK